MSDAREIWVLTEGGIRSGFGHITRTLGVVHALREVGFQVHYRVDGDESVEGVLSGVNGRRVNWTERDGLSEVLAEPPRMVLVDSYRASPDTLTMLAEIAENIVFIDDDFRVSYPAGIILNGAIGAEKLPYAARFPGHSLLLGIRYAPMRPTFWKTNPRVTKKSIEEVLITFGGDDRRNLTPSVLSRLRRIAPSVRKSVIVGAAYENREEIERAGDDRTELIVSPEASKLRGLMERADLAISASGQTLYELAVCGTPTLSIQIIENQSQNAVGWSEAGFTEHLGIYSDSTLLERLSVAWNLLQDVEVRERRAAAGQALCDGQGARRLATFLESKLCRNR